MVRDEEARSAFLAGETYYNYNFCLQVAQTFETFIIDNETRGALRGINPYGALTGYTFVHLLYRLHLCAPGKYLKLLLKVTALSSVIHLISCPHWSNLWLTPTQ